MSDRSQEFLYFLAMLAFLGVLFLFPWLIPLLIAAFYWFVMRPSNLAEKAANERERERE